MQFTPEGLRERDRLSEVAIGKQHFRAVAFAIDSARMQQWDHNARLGEII